MLNFMIKKNLKMRLTVINPACSTGHAQYAQRATMHITWTRLMSYWVPIIAKLCFKWTKYTVGLKLFWWGLQNSFSVTIISKRPDTSINPHSEYFCCLAWAHVNTKDWEGNQNDYIIEPLQSVDETRWKQPHNLSNGGRAWQCVFLRFTTRSIKVNTNTQTFYLN